VICRLALETATGHASVAVGRGETVLADVRLDRRTAAAELAPAIAACLDRAGVFLADLEEIVVADGPGSFTGLRTGWATMQGLARAAGLRVTSIPSLLNAASAAAGHAPGSAPVVLSCYDALRGSVYAAVYRCGPGMDVLLEPTLTTIERLASSVPARPDLVIGDGALRHAAAVRDAFGCEPRDGPPTAGNLIRLAARPGVGRTLSDPGTAEPSYGRLAEAQARWERTHGRPLPDPSRTA